MQSDRIKKLIEAAISVRQNAYAPYSNFKVGAALYDEAGELHLGCNVENASYPNGVCAETAAICNMVAAGGKQCVDIVVVGTGEVPITPCGLCRQVLSEFSEPHANVYCCTPDKKTVQVFEMSELLPFKFSSDDLSADSKDD